MMLDAINLRNLKGVIKIYKETKLIYTSNDVIERSYVGSKAYFLFKLSKMCNILPLVCVDARAFNLFLKLEQNRNLRNKIMQAFSNKLGLMSILEEIRNDVCQMYIPDEFVDELLSKISAEGMKGPYAIRSSSPFEDNAKQSGAGIYESYTEVEENDIINNIKMCWAAQFSVRTLSYNSNISSIDDLNMAVIIQQYQYAVKSGVMFSVDPVCPSNGMRIEVVSGNCEKLMSGEISAEKIIHGIVNGDECVLSESDSEAWISELCFICNNISDKLGYEVDIEWLYDGEKIYILQCRPITTVVDEAKSEWLKTILDINDIPIDEMGSLSLKAKKFKIKHVFYRHCIDENVPILAWYFLRYSKSSDIDKYAEQITSASKGGHYSVMVNSLLTDFQCDADGLAPMLRKIVEMSRTETIMVSIRWIPHNEYSLICYYEPVRKITRIECVPGVMKGLKSGYLKPTVYIADENCNIIDTQRVHYDKYYDIDLMKDKFFITECDMYISGIDEQIKQIAKYAQKLYNRFVSGVIEWWICDGEVYATDCSIEFGSINKLDYCEKGEEKKYCLSKGNVKGSLFIFTDEMIQKLDNFSYSTAVSVTDFDQSINDIDIIKEISDKIKALKEKYGKVILATEWPCLSICPFLNIADGIVFKYASMLCHLSVIIREKGIPCVCIGEDYYNLKNEDMYKI